MYYINSHLSYSTIYVGRDGFEPTFSTSYLYPSYQDGGIPTNLMITTCQRTKSGSNGNRTHNLTNMERADYQLSRYSHKTL